MKLLYCQDCGDIVAPFPQARKVRYCQGGCHAVWWEDSDRGILRVCVTYGHPEVIKRTNGAPAGLPRAWVLGLTNMLLFFPSDRTPNAEEVQEIVDAHEDYYIFKKTRSLVIRVRPGQSSDTAWALLPEWENKNDESEGTKDGTD